jgi:hypothetical protein
MGVSTDAMLMYGVPLHEDEDLTYDEDAADAPTSGPGHMNYMGHSEDGCEIVEHCSGECPQYFVIVQGTLTRAWRGHPKEVVTREAESDWDDRLKNFCKKHNLSHRKPGWYIASMWD